MLNLKKFQLDRINISKVIKSKKVLLICLCKKKKKKIDRILP